PIKQGIYRRSNSSPTYCINGIYQVPAQVRDLARHRMALRIVTPRSYCRTLPGQPDGYPQTPWRSVGEYDLPVMEPDDLESQGQAEAEAPGLGREERAQLGPGLGAQAGAVVGDGDDRVRRVARHLHPDVAAGARGLARVPDEVLEGPLEQRLVAGQASGVAARQRDIPSGAAARLAGHHAGEHSTEVERLHVERLLLHELHEAA